MSDLRLLSIQPASTEARVLRLLIELGAQFVGAEEGSLLVFDEEKNELVFAMTVGESDGLLGQRLAVGQGLTGLAAATREVQIGAPTFHGVKQVSEGPEAVIAAPMLVDDELVGVITAVSFTKGKRFDARDGDLYGRLAAIAGVVVDQHRRLEATTRNDGVEHALATSLARIVKRRPDAVAHLTALISAIESLVELEKER